MSTNDDLYSQFLEEQSTDYLQESIVSIDKQIKEIRTDSRSQISSLANTRVLTVKELRKRGAALKAKPRIPFTVCISVLDGEDPDPLRTHIPIDLQLKVYQPTTAAIKFIEDHSRFKITPVYNITTIPHIYNNGDGSGTNVNVLTEEIPLAYRNSLPVADTFLFLFSLNGRNAQLGGSTLGADRGVLSGGKYRPISTIPVDDPGYNNNPYQGFNTQSSQICSHEIINAFNLITALAPYFCTPMVGTDGLPSFDYEASRLACLTPADYVKLRNRIISAS